MNSIIIVAIVFGSILTFAALICGTILAILKIRNSGLSRHGTNAKSEEARIIQEIYQGLNQMEDRIEALETILMEGKDKKGHCK